MAEDSWSFEKRVDVRLYELTSRRVRYEHDAPALGSRREHVSWRREHGLYVRDHDARGVARTLLSRLGADADLRPVDADPVLYRASFDPTPDVPEVDLSVIVEISGLWVGKERISLRDDRYYFEDRRILPDGERVPLT